jgi:hypothetical protein
MKIESWHEMRAALGACQDFLEGALSETEIERGEWCGAMHGARLLGHVTDAMLIATWIIAVADAHEKNEK